MSNAITSQQRQVQTQINVEGREKVVLRVVNEVHELGKERGVNVSSFGTSNFLAGTNVKVTLSGPEALVDAFVRGVKYYALNNFNDSLKDWVDWR